MKKMFILLVMTLGFMQGNAQNEAKFNKFLLSGPELNKNKFSSITPNGAFVVSSVTPVPAFIYKPDLNTFTPIEETDTSWTSISNDGNVVVGEVYYKEQSPALFGAILKNETMYLFPPLDDYKDKMIVISGDGNTTVGNIVKSDESSIATSWDIKDPANVTRVQYPLRSGFVRAELNSVSNDGSVMVGNHIATTTYPILIINQENQDIVFNPADFEESTISDMNAKFHKVSPNGKYVLASGQFKNETGIIHFAAIYSVSEKTFHCFSKSNNPTGGYHTGIAISDHKEVIFSIGVFTESRRIPHFLNKAGEVKNFKTYLVEEGISPADTNFTLSPVGISSNGKRIIGEIPSPPVNRASWIALLGKDVLQAETFYPENGAVDVPVDAEVSIVFKTSAYALYPQSLDSIHFSGAVVSIKGDKLIFTHSNLEYSQEYTVTIPANIFMEQEEAITWTFTTEAEPIAEISQTEWNAGDVIVGESLQSPKLILRNTGAAVLTVSEITLDANWSTTLVPSSVTLAAGEKYEFDFTFQPQTKGEFNQTIVITTNAGDLTIQLSGKGIAKKPIAEISQTEWNAGDVIVGESLQSPKLILRNTGAAVLTVSEITLDANWSTTLVPSSVTLAAGEKYEFDFTFQPQTKGEFNQTIVITTNAGDLTIQLKGKGVVEDIILSPVTYIPASALTGVALDTEVSVVFNIDITATSADSLKNISIIQLAAGTTSMDNLNVSIVGNKLIIGHEDLAPKALCIVEIPKGTLIGQTEAISWIFTTVDPIGISSVEALTVKIYPNPSSGLVNITVPEKSSVKIIDVRGAIMESHTVEANSTIHIVQPKGIYFVKIETKNNAYIQKVIIR